jgi:hypothetical protein
MLYSGHGGGVAAAPQSWARVRSTVFRVLSVVAETHDATFGVQSEVKRHGRVAVGFQ